MQRCTSKTWNGVPKSMHYAPERRHEADKHRRDIIKLFSLAMPPAPTGLPDKVLNDVKTFVETVMMPPDLMKSSVSEPSGLRK